jgi:hypothetical protein
MDLINPNPKIFDVQFDDSFDDYDEEKVDEFDAHEVFGMHNFLSCF